MPDTEPSTKKVFNPCHGSGGRFARCPGTPAPRRRHRRRYSDTANCACPEGSEQVPSAKGRGFACSARTKEGARFVRMQCSTDTPSKASGTATSSPTSPKAKSKAKRQKLDWNRCACPPGADKRVSSKGKTQCVKRDTSGRLAFVKAVCPGGVEGFAGLRKRRK